VTVARSIEQGRENYVYSITLLQIAPRLLRLSGFGLAYWYLPGLEGIATALLISYYLPVTIFGVQRQEWRWMNISEIKYSDWRFSGELFLNSMASQLFQNLDVLLITALASSIATSNYQVAWKIALVIGYTNQILSTVLKPRLSSYLANNNPAELRQEFTIVRDTTIIFASFTLLVAVVAGETLLSLFGEYSDSYPLLVVLATGQFVNTSFGNVHNVLMMGKEGRLILLNSILGIGINFLGNLLLIPLYHELGAAISTVLTVFIFSNIVAVWLIQHSLDVKLFDLYATGGAFACGSLIITFVFLRLPAHRTISGVALIVFCIALVHHNRAEIVSQYQDLQS
jgi:O-antigen/teichoic acid export membrane protein